MDRFGPYPADRRPGFPQSADTSLKGAEDFLFNRDRKEKPHLVPFIQHFEEEFQGRLHRPFPDIFPAPWEMK